MSPNKTIDGWLRLFAKEFVANRAKDIVQRDLRNSETLLRSLYAKVITEPERGVFLMTFFASGYGRFQDMRRRYARSGGTEMEMALEQWAETEGIDNFRKGKYSGIYRGKTDQQVANAIAWGIIKKYKTKPPPKRGWYNTGKTRDIENFYDVLLRVYRDAVLDELKMNATS